MTRLWIRLIPIVLAASVAIAHGASPPPRVSLRLDGLICSFCARGLQEILRKQPAVERFELKLERGTVTLFLRDGQPVPEETELREWSRQAGLKLASFEIER